MKKFIKRIGLTKKYILWSACFIVFFLAVFLVQKLLFPQITLTGGKKIVVEYKETYKENGYKASYLGKNISNDVKVSGKVNTEKLGEYKVSYEVGNGFFKTKVVRTVSVSDTTKPKLEVSKDDVYACPGTKYKAEKVKATDNYDGDLTKKVESEVGKNFVTYRVVDSSGNKKEITKKLYYKDVEKPVVELVGSDVVDMCINDVYKEPGYTASDNCDGDLKDVVTVEGSVDNSLAGEYDITYKAKDASGNEGSATRKVRVGSGDEDGVVYLTFDDGPNEGTTNVILDILKEEGVQATFFVTNKGPDDLIVREFNEGHTVALHTASHDYSIVYASVDAYFNDLQQVHDRVYNLTGYDSKFIRFPGGASNTVSRRYSNGIMSRLTAEVVNRGYKYYDWNISSGDAGETTDPDRVYSNVVNSLRKDRVNMVLMHDIKPYTRDALRSIIRYCKENGYQMKKISNCTKMITQKVNN